MYVLIIERTGELVRDSLGRVAMVERESFAHKLAKHVVQLSIGCKDMFNSFLPLRIVARVWVH